MSTKSALSPENTIDFRDVAVRIRPIPGSEILSGISLTVSHGETLVLLGRSGSGKTTLLKLINGMLVPTSGEVLVQGRPTTAWDRCRTAVRVGELLTLVGLDPSEFADRRPRELSGGQRQRVGVARALAVDPHILLMDEPFGALDPVTRAELQREFSALVRRLGKTIVFVTHDLREALLLASRIVLLQAGRIVASATPQEFLRLDHAEVRAFTASLAVAPGDPA